MVTLEISKLRAEFMVNVIVLFCSNHAAVSVDGSWEVVKLQFFFLRTLLGRLHSTACEILHQVVRALDGNSRFDLEVLDCVPGMGLCFGPRERRLLLDVGPDP